MNDELKQRLIEQYPEIFPSGKFPIEVGDGWYTLLDLLCQQINFIADACGVSWVATRIKQKFGRLEVYLKPDEDEVKDVSEQVLNLAGSIIFAVTNHAGGNSTNYCEECGAVGDLSRKPSGFIQTLCEKCRKEVNAEVVDNF